MNTCATVTCKKTQTCTHRSIHTASLVKYTKLKLLIQHINQIRHWPNNENIQKKLVCSEQTVLLKFQQKQLLALIDRPFFCGLVVEELRWTRCDNACGFVTEWDITLLLTASLFSLAGRDVVVAGVPVDCAGWTRSDRLLPGWDDSLGKSSCCNHGIITQHSACYTQLNQPQRSHTQVHPQKTSPILVSPATSNKQVL